MHNVITPAGKGCYGNTANQQVPDTLT